MLKYRETREEVRYKMADILRESIELKPPFHPIWWRRRYKQFTLKGGWTLIFYFSLDDRMWACEFYKGDGFNTSYHNKLFLNNRKKIIKLVRISIAEVEIPAFSAVNKRLKSNVVGSKTLDLSNNKALFSWVSRIDQQIADAKKSKN